MTKKEIEDLKLLLSLDGYSFVYSDPAESTINFSFKTAIKDPARPHGLRYSLTMIDKKGNRLIGFDNAHEVTKTQGKFSKKAIAYDHKHIGNRRYLYIFESGTKLLEDFWKAVERQEKK